MSIQLLIAACPKPFVEPFNVIQQNAINSWTNMEHPSINIHITLFGDEKGVQEASHQINCQHVKHIKKNKFGTPLVNDIFIKINAQATQLQLQYPNDTIVCCYINADIITFNCMLDNIVDFIETKKTGIFTQLDPTSDENVWLLVGCRWDTDNVPRIDFTNNNWKHDIKQQAIETGKDHGCWGIDYFIFGLDTFNYVYPFALGKFVWDRWLVGNVFRRDSIAVDITQTNFVIHQNGDWYQTCTGGATSDRRALFSTEEVQINQSFDYYEKDINSGTRWETRQNKQNIEFIQKQNIPRSL